MLKNLPGLSFRTWLLALIAILAGMVPASASLEDQYRQWLANDLWPAARAQGVSQATFNAAFAGTRLKLDLPDLEIPGKQAPVDGKQHQAEFRAPSAYFQHIGGVVSGGRSMASRHASTLAAIEKRYGVPRGIVLAIWGRESGFGNAKIPHDAFEVLGTKAFLSRRKDMFRAEVLAALRMVQQSGINPRQMKSSWAGAMGQPQFMPTSYLKFAADGDGDGRADIWNSEADTLASIANYLAVHGWVRGRDWGFEVVLPNNVSCALEGPDRGRTIREWQSFGINRVGGKAFPAHELNGEAYLMLPAGRYGPAFLVTPNFYRLKDYNESDLYALFVGHAADRIMYGDITFQTPWRKVDAMTRGQVAAMQRSLEAQGFDVGGADGLVGFKTRRSIGVWQERREELTTCFPDRELLGRLR